jgi:DNA processing protein
MAVPGAPLDPRAAGCNDLIRQGAALIRDADDVEEALAAPRVLTLAEGATEFLFEEPSAPEPGLAERAAALLGPAPVDADILTRDLGAPPAQVAAALLELDLAGRIERRPGGMIALAAG